MSAWREVDGEAESTDRLGLYSVGVNALLVALKGGLAVVSGSLALAADAVHSLVDVVGSLIVLAGLLIARRRSRSFPYGLYKVENVVSVILAFLIFLAGYEIAREAVLSPPREVTYVPVALAGVGLAMIVPYLFSRYEQRVAERSGSPSLRADSQHFRADVLSSAVVFAALLGDAFRLPLDRVGAAVVVLFIVRAGWGLLVDGMRVLLDASLSRETLDQIRGVIAADRNVAEIRSLVGRNSGRYKFIEAELTLRMRDLGRAHRVSQRIEDAIRASVPHVDRVLIHYEPVQKEVMKWAVPLDSMDGKLSPHFGEAPYFALIGVRRADGAVSGYELLANPYLGVERQKGIRAAKFLIEQGIDGVVLRESLEGKGPSYVLTDAGVETQLTGEETLSDLYPDLPVQVSASSV